MGWLICGNKNLVDDSAIIQQKEALEKKSEQFLEEEKEFDRKRTEFFHEQQLLTKNLEIRAEEHQQILRLFQKEVSDFRQVFKEFRQVKTQHMRVIDQQADPRTFETLKELYFKFKEKEEKLCGPKFYQNGVEIDKKDVPSNGEGVIMTNYLCCMEEVLSEGALGGTLQTHN